MNRKKIIPAAVGCLLLLGVAVGLWKALAAPTKVAFVNYQAIELGQIARANDNSFVKISELAVDELDRAADFDMVFVNGMGLRLDDGQRRALVEAAQNGTPVMTTAATNPQNHIVSVDSVDMEFLKQYLAGGRANYRNLLRYVRRFIDLKRLFCDEASDPQPSATSLMYYPSAGGEDAADFASVAAFENFLRASGRWKEGAPRVILTGQMGVPDSLVAALERRGCMVYPVGVIQRFIAGGHADSVAPSAIVNMAHGRMGDAVVRYLEANNIPLFSPLNVNRPYSDWMADKMGMNGGFLSQSIVTPEIDGALLPYSLFAHYEGPDGLPCVAAIPDRLESFTATVANYLALRRKANADKRVAIFYFKGPGQNALVAEGMEVAPSLFNLLQRLKAEGYDVGSLPASAAELEAMIAGRGKVFGGYAAGAMAYFVRDADPEIIARADYERWCTASLSPSMRAEIDAVDGPFPGHGLHDAEGNLALARLRFGNVVLIPQTAAGLGDDDFKIVHGTDAAPPHAYVASYLWARHGFGADAIIHFGAHGSLEFTPRKQVALGSGDWPDRLVGTMPHVYVYSTSNVGEAMMAKRRSYAGIVNYLTPPFMESNVRGIYRSLTEAIDAYNKIADADRPDPEALRRASLLVKRHAVRLGIHRELRLDSVAGTPYQPENIARIESFAEELANERVTGALYVMGRPYSGEQIASTVRAMTVDPLAYSLHKLGRSGKSLRACRATADALIGAMLAEGRAADDATICRVAGISRAELDSARRISSAIEGSRDMLSRMMVMGAMMPSKPAGTPARIANRPEVKKHHGMLPGMSAEKALAMARKMGADEEAIKKMEAAIKRKGMAGAAVSHSQAADGEGPGISPAEMDFAANVGEVERALSNVGRYREALLTSPAEELSAIVNALNGGYISPSSGGDPVLNPAILPTGRNMFAVNAEETPSVQAWEKGKTLAERTITMYGKAHSDSIPRKVSYTLWSSEFIETEGATIAQVLYMLGVEPVRDPFGRVTDLRLIPSAELGRPRIDVVVQTSGQLRDLAASRLFLIDRAVKMAAAAASDDVFANYVAEGAVESERHMVSRGVTPREARELSTARVFGGVGGNYGSGIQAMVEAGDRWDNTDDIAATYMHNMGAIYGSPDDWEKMRDYAFEAALTRTDVVVQPRQSNTWGALSLDHVYEFMGGMNLAVRKVTGKEPEAYLSDYRRRNNARMQEVKEAIGVESRTTILNPSYLKEKMKGGAGDASALADVVRNTYGWNVMKPEAIDDELWDDIYETYVTDRNGLGIKEYFRGINPAALQEITAVMLETVRKGMWDASPEQIKAMAELHTEMVNEVGAACSGFVCDNARLREFIAANVDASRAAAYNSRIAGVRAERIVPDAQSDAAMVMKSEELNSQPTVTSRVNGLLVALGVVLALCLFGVVVAARRRRSRKEGGDD